MLAEKPRILIACNSYPPAISGTGVFVYNLVKYLRKKYDFIVVTPNSDIKLIADTQIDHMRRVIRVPSIKLPYVRTFHVTFTSMKLLGKINADIIHVHSFMQIHSDVLTSLSIVKRLPVIYSIHGWMNIEMDFLRPLLKVYESVIPLVLALVSKITVLGSRSKKYIESLLAMVTDDKKIDKKIEIVPNGVEFYEIREIVETCRDDNDKTIILYAGRLTPKKGVLDLLKAFYLVHKLHKDTLLIMAGDGPLKHSLIKISEKLNIRNSIVIRAVPHKELICKYLSKANVFVLPSYAEGQPTAILEAMSAGVPVIATNVGDVPDLITHGKTGLLITPGNIKELTKAMLTLLEDNNLRNIIMLNGLGIAEAHNWRYISEKIDKIYTEVLNNMYNV